VYIPLTIIKQSEKTPTLYCTTAGKSSGKTPTKKQGRKTVFLHQKRGIFIYTWKIIALKAAPYSGGKRDETCIYRKPMDCVPCRSVCAARLSQSNQQRRQFKNILYRDI
jgi:hypothetical protein